MHSQVYSCSALSLLFWHFKTALTALICKYSRKIAPIFQIIHQQRNIWHMKIRLTYTSFFFIENYTFRKSHKLMIDIMWRFSVHEYAYNIIELFIDAPQCAFAFIAIFLLILESCLLKFASIRAGIERIMRPYVARVCAHTYTRVSKYNSVHIHHIFIYIYIKYKSFLK